MVDRFPESTIGALVFNRKGEALLLKSNKWRGNWTVPAGHIEFGELMEDAVKREVAEETGLNVENVCFLTLLERISSPEFHRDGHFICHNYFCDSLSDQVTLNDEAEDFLWAFPQKVLEMDDVDSITRQSFGKYIQAFGLKSNVNVSLGIYEHYKGNRYEVLQNALHSESLRKMVVYRGLYEHPEFGKNPVFVRPAGMFAEEIIIDGKKVPRFRKIN